MERVPCNLCGHDDAVPYMRVRDLFLERSDVHADLVQCTHCGLVYQNPRPSADEILAHYPLEYELYNDPVAAQQRGGLRQWANSYGMRKRCRYVTKHVAAGALLDVGCAAGTFLLAMRSTGDWTVTGVELNAEVARQTRERYGLDVIAGTLEDAHLAPAQFDAVTMWDVLEHVYDPVATLREIHRLLKPGGILVIRVPNLSSWDARLFGCAWAGYDAPRHLYFFNPATLTALLEQSGLEVKAHSTAISNYMVFALDVRYWMTARGVAASTKARVSRLLYHPVTRLVTAPFFYFTNFGLRGPALVTTARKPVPT